MDRDEFPAPAVRFGENTKEVVELREKELGDWKALSLKEKKALYRASFRMTFAEMSAPTGEWKSVLAAILFGLSLTGWLAIWIKVYVLPEMPHTITREWQEKQLELLVKQRQGAVTGISSRWDYDNNRWK
jgi:cytochrome c oxidase subunit 4